MKRLVFAAFFAATLVAQAAPPSSCVKVLDRAKSAVAALEKQSFAPVHAQIGRIAKGKKAAFSRDLDAGTFAAFAVTEESFNMGLELTVREAGKELKKTEAVSTAFIAELTVEAKGKVELELEVDEATSNDPGPYIIVLLQKQEGAPSTADIVFEKLGDRAKAVEDGGQEVVFGEMDTIADKAWTVTHKLEAGNYAVEVVTDDASVKDLEVEFTDGSGASVAKKAKSAEPKDGNVASLKGEAKAGDAKVAVTAVFQEGCGNSFAGVLIAKK
jgi:hypothetical protein